MKRSFSFMTLLLIVCMIAIFSVPVMAADFDLEDAVTNAGEGSTVTVPEGTYAVNLVINKSITLVADGNVVLTRPWTEYDTENHYGLVTLMSQGEEVVQNPEDMPVITVLDSGAVTLEGFTFAQPVSGDWMAEYTTIGILAGSGVDLTLDNCTVGNGFVAPVVVTTWEDVFTQALGNINDLDIVGDLFSMRDAVQASSLAMNSCYLSDYELAGAVLLGDGVTAELNSNMFNGDDMDKRVLAGDADMAMQEVANLGLSAVSGTLFANAYLPFGGVGVLVVNSNADQVIMEGNTFTHNLAGVAAIKELSQRENTSLLDPQAAVEAGEGLSIETGNTFFQNILGVVALGGLDVLLEWNVVSTDLLISPDIAWGNDSTMPLFIQETDFTGNIVSTVLAGKVKATVDDNLYSGDLAANLVGIGDLSESYITDNEFNGTIGASMVFALQMADIEGALEKLGYPGIIEEGSLNIEQAGMLTVSGNTISGNGPIEGVHEFIFGPEQAVAQAMDLGQRTAENGPLAILPSVSTLDDDDDYVEIGPEDISLAGIVLLDGARNISIEENTIGGTLLGITAIDTGIIENIQSVDITDNTVEENICGLTLLGGAEILVPLVEDILAGQDFMSSDNKLLLGEVSGNSFSNNHIGMISALSVEGTIHDNLFDDNELLGMVHIGVGDWLLSEILPPFVVSGDICPQLTITRNSISGNGTNTADRPSVFDMEILEGVTPADFLCGGALVIDAAHGITLNENNIEGNGNFGVLSTARALYDPADLVPEEVVSIDVNSILDAGSNWWGSENGPSSYSLSDDIAPGADGNFFLDPENGDPADGHGDSLGSFLIGVDGTYYPFTLTGPVSLSASEINVLFLEQENTIKFSEWAEEPYVVEAGTDRSSGGGLCGVASFTPSLLLLLAPLTLLMKRK